MKINKLPLLFMLAWVALSQSSLAKDYGISDLHKEKEVHTVFSQSKNTAEIQKKIHDYLAMKGINGNVAVMAGGKILFNEGVGFANISSRKPNQPLTSHPIGSITKAIVATSVLQLQDSGKLSIHDPVAKYIPQFPNGENIQLIHLLNHTSGIKPPHWNFGNRTPEKLIEALQNRPVKFAPGSRWDYKDANYMILGYIVEKVSGMTLHEYIEKNLFEQAGMLHSGFMTEEYPTENSSVGYIRKLNRTLPWKALNAESLFGFADIYSTASDICRYDQALMSGKLISKSSLAEMLTPGSSSGYGLGLYNLGYAVYSRGVIGGWESLHVYYKDKTSITILLNVRDKTLDIHQLSKDIFKILSSQTQSPLAESGDFI